jgi:hypothetical protein
MRAREWPALEPLLFGGALALYAAGLPLGLDRASAAPAVAGAATMDGGAPLGLLVARLLGCLPLGDLAARANLASALAGAVAVALLGRLACETVRLLAPGRESRQPTDAVEPVAAAGAAAVAALALGAFRTATGAGSAALTVALAAAAWVNALVLVRAPEDRRAGLRLALLAGLAAGVEPVAAPLVWLPALFFWFRALRRGARWPLAAPVLFVAGLGVVLFAVAVSRTGPTAGELLGALWPARATGEAVGLAAIEAGDQLGVVGLLLVALGALVLVARAPLAGTLLLGTVGAGVWLSGTGVRLAAAAVAAPLAVGIVHLARKLGRARLAAATAIAVMAVVSPALDGGSFRWTRDGRLPARLLARALVDVPLRARVDPGTPEMSGLFHYAASLGLRPDITVARRQ